MTAIDLRHGYTLHDLYQMAAAVLKADRSLAMDYADRRDIAWSAIAEALYSAEDPPTRQELIRVGWQAIYREVRDGYRHYGYADRAWDAGHASAPRFAAYWLGWRSMVPSHEERVVERLALPAILAALTDHQRQALTALAAWGGDRAAAATAVGVGEKALNHQLRMGRRACLALWLEGETPRQVSMRRLDYRHHRGRRRHEPEGGAAAGQKPVSRPAQTGAGTTGQADPIRPAAMAATGEIVRRVLD